MQINITLTPEQEKALLTEHASIEQYTQAVIENRANRIIDDIVNNCTSGKVSIAPLSVEEQALVSKAVESRIVVRADRLPDEIKRLFVQKANIPTMVEKIRAQELEAV